MRVKLSRPVEITFNGEPHRFDVGWHAVDENFCARLKATDPEAVEVAADGWDLANIASPAEVAQLVAEVEAANEPVAKPKPPKKPKPPSE